MATFKVLDSESLVLRMKAGDMTAFDELYAQNYEWVYQVALKRLSSPQDAEEATNDAFMQIWKAFTNWSPEPKKFGAWFNTITHNAIITYYHRKNRKRDSVHQLSTEDQMLWVEKTVADTRAPDSLTAIVSDDLVHHIEEALCSLKSSRQRLAWILRYFEGYKLREVANILNTKSSNVRRYLEYCNMSLRRILKRKGIGVESA